MEHLEIAKLHSCAGAGVCLVVRKWTSAAHFAHGHQESKTHVLDMLVRVTVIFFHWIALYLGWQNPYQKVIVKVKTSHLAFVSAFNLFRIREIMRGTNYIICA